MGLFTRQQATLADNVREMKRSGLDAVKPVAREANGAAGAVANDAGSQLRKLLDDIDATVNNTVVNEAKNLRKTLRGKLAAIRPNGDGAVHAVGRQYHRALNQADDFVHDKPWHTVGAIAGAALLIGFLAGKK